MVYRTTLGYSLRSTETGGVASSKREDGAPAACIPPVAVRVANPFA